MASSWCRLRFYLKDTEKERIFHASKSIPASLLCDAINNQLDTRFKMLSPPTLIAWHAEATCKDAQFRDSTCNELED